MWSPLSGPRNVALRGAAGLSVIVLCGVAASPASAKPKLAAWSLIGAANATSVWIAPSDSTIAYCHRLEVRRLRVTRAHVRLQLEATAKSDAPCSIPAVLRAPDRLRVRIPGGIDGRRITGPRMERDSILPMFWSEWNPVEGATPNELAAPRLLGLHAKDATNLLARLAVKAPVEVSGQGGEVTQQTPAPGEIFAAETAAFRLTTT